MAFKITPTKSRGTSSATGMLLVEMMVYQKKNIKQLLQSMEKEFGAYYYERLDLTIERRVTPEKSHLLLGR